MELSSGHNPFDRFSAKFPGRAGLSLRLVQADGLALPFPDASFDAALMVSVLSGVAEWRRAIRAGGSLVIGRAVRPPGYRGSRTA